MAASALLTLLSSPSPHGGHHVDGPPARKRHKGNARGKNSVKGFASSQKKEPGTPTAHDVLLDPSTTDDEWLYRKVELVRGKYKGRSAQVVGMTAKKYRVRVEGVEHQLEFYSSMFKRGGAGDDDEQASAPGPVAVPVLMSPRVESIAPNSTAG